MRHGFILFFIFFFLFLVLISTICMFTCIILFILFIEIGYFASRSYQWLAHSDLKICTYQQVLATRTKIYIILEFITGGELFDKIVSLIPSVVIGSARQLYSPNKLFPLGIFPGSHLSLFFEVIMAFIKKNNKSRNNLLQTNNV